VPEIEESREETEKELQGSDKKVSKDVFLLGLATNQRGIDKIKTKWRSGHTSLREVCASQ
jgi:hypothetical protein